MKSSAHSQNGKRFFTVSRVICIVHAVVLFYAASIVTLSVQSTPTVPLLQNGGFWFSLAVALPLTTASGGAYLALLTGNLHGCAIFFSTFAMLACAALPFMTALALPACVLSAFLSLLYGITCFSLIRDMLNQAAPAKPLG